MASLAATDAVLASRVRKKFEKLEETCMERYQAREQRVVSILNFCIGALEQLQNWALFGIFPGDEESSERYLQFVEQRFSCVLTPLRLFDAALQRESSSNHHGHHHQQQHFGSGMFTRRSPLSPPDSPKFSHGGARYSPPPPTSLTAGDSSSRLDGAPSLRQGLPLTPPPPVSPLNATANSTDSGVFVGDSKTESLRDRISGMTDTYIEEGQGVRKGVLQKLQKCRKDMRTIYRWGHASLMDLQDVLDDSLSDELYFLVRGKMQRILSTLSAFEEAGDQTEKKLSNYFQNQPKAAPGTSDAGFEAPDFVLDLPKKDSPRYEAMDLRLNLEALELSPVTPRVGRDRGGGGEEGLDSGESTRGSTPEPPTSPRPKGLVNHPKIMKDKLQNYALPSKFSGLRLSSPW